MEHLTTADLEARLDEVRQSPTDHGTVELIVQRPQVGMRVVLDDGSSHPDMQLNIMNSRILAMVAQQPERMALAGDQLVVDMDLSEVNLPAWTKLAIGDAVIEITDQPHNGCAKFTARFGLDAHRFVNSEVGKELHLRGVNARVLTPGTIRRGDTIRKL